MSVPKKGKSLLSTREKERLKDPPVQSNTRKRNNLIVKEKIKRWLNDANDIAYALEYLKNTKIEGVFPDEDIFALFDATEKLLDRLNFAPVEGEPQHPVIAQDSIFNFTRRATPSDLERNWRVQRHVKVLQHFYPSNPKEESPAYRIYRQKKEYQEREEFFAEHGVRLKEPLD